MTMRLVATKHSPRSSIGVRWDYRVHSLPRPVVKALLFTLLFIRALPLGAAEVPVSSHIEADLSALRINALEKRLNRRFADFSELKSSASLTWLAAEGSRLLSDELRSKGWYQARIESTVSDARRRIHYRISLGCRIRYRHIDIELTDSDSEITVPAAVAPSAWLDHASYEKAANGFLGSLYRDGYLWARWQDKQVVVDVPACMADLTWQVQRGPQARLGELSTTSGPIPKDLLLRTSGLTSGQTLRPAALAKARRALLASSWFDDVNIDMDTAHHRDGEVDATIEVQMAKPNVYEASAGFSTDKGPLAGLGWERRWLAGLGHSAGVRYELAGTGSTLSLNYTIPLATERQIAHYFTASRKEEDNNGLRTSTRSLDWLWALRFGDWRVSPGVSFQKERQRTDAIRDDSQMLLARLGVVREKLDDPLWPRQGYRLEFGSQVAADSAFSDQDALRLRAAASLIVPISQQLGVKLQATTGRVFANDTDSLPSNLRFFAGGDRSVRGYRYQALSPEDVSGAVIGGRSLITGSVEGLWYFRSNWAATLFVDAGSAYDTRPESWPRGYGAGARWRSPVGQVSLDLARAEHPSFQDWRVHFRLGMDF